MPFRSVIDPDQLAGLHAIYREFCDETGLKLDDPQAEVVATRIMVLFTGGLSIDEIARALRDGQRMAG